MISKTLIAAAAVAILAVGVSAPANAKVKVDLYVGGFDQGYYEPDYPVYPVYEPAPRPRRHYPRYEEEVDYDRYGISCEDGRLQVKYAGFRKVRALDCDGKRYSYRARRNGNTFIVKVSSRNGNIVSVQEAY
jgi:hypothetical protein